MPYCELSSNGIKIFYRRYGHGSTKVLLIIGLAGTHESWGPQIKGLTGTLEPNDEETAAPMVSAEAVGGGLGEEGRGENGIEVCCFDNRGVGRSSVPIKKSEYTTTIMAEDALALLDHLGWKKAHVFGHSMGAMIACKLAAIAPDRICSLALLNVTGGGFECFPKIDFQVLSLAFRFLRAKTPEERASVDLETHYSKDYLDEHVGSCTRRDVLYQKYVKAISSNGMQPTYGFEGQVNACWTHNMTSKELDTIRCSGFLVSVIHGRFDIIAQIDHARRLADKLHPAARMVELHGGHLVSHERPDEVNLALIELIKASESKLKPEEWSHIPERQSGWLVSGTQMPLTNRDKDGANSLLILCKVLGKLQLNFLYFFGTLVMGCEHISNTLRIKPIRVAASDS
ncbi:hypothetical protein Cni_G00055 [Canna indica]|uniref:AB hydrolase-1 domain-containing protein n=1 Tax=Canna indica TaxID=4628 RepID=A0AAQ3JM56_9LILI|nr:hypothetical protein Cni_G00055 [Canna indica]